MALHFDKRGMYKGINPLASALPIITDPSQSATETQTFQALRENVNSIRFKGIKFVQYKPKKVKTFTPKIERKTEDS